MTLTGRRRRLLGRSNDMRSAVKKRPNVQLDAKVRLGEHISRVGRPRRVDHARHTLVEAAPPLAVGHREDLHGVAAEHGAEHELRVGREGHALDLVDAAEDVQHLAGLYVAQSEARGRDDGQHGEVGREERVRAQDAVGEAEGNLFGRRGHVVRHDAGGAHFNLRSCARERI